MPQGVEAARRSDAGTLTNRAHRPGLLRLAPRRAISMAKHQSAARAAGTVLTEELSTLGCRVTWRGLALLVSRIATVPASGKSCPSKRASSPYRQPVSNAARANRRKSASAASPDRYRLAARLPALQLRTDIRIGIGPDVLPADVHVVGRLGIAAVAEWQNAAVAARRCPRAGEAMTIAITAAATSPFVYMRSCFPFRAQCRCCKRPNVIRTHWSLDKDAPVSRPVQRIGSIKSHAILGGLHHLYLRV